MAWENPKQNWGQAGQTVPGAEDFNRIEGNIDILGKYDRAPGYGTATGTNAKSITLSPAPGSYYDGLCFAFKNATQNTGAVTINVNGMGAKPLKKPNGNDVTAGFLKAGSVYTVRYNGTNFILQGSDSTGDAMPEHVLAGKTFSNDTDTELTGTMPNRAGDTAALASSVSGTTLKLLASRGYRDGVDDTVTITDANFVAANIVKDISVFGLTGTAKRRASGSGTTPTNGQISVSGLSFRPAYIICESTYAGSTTRRAVYYSDTDRAELNTKQYSHTSVGTLDANFNISDDGFTVTIANLGAVQAYNWIAFE